jgi:hypothetical protein
VDGYRLENAHIYSEYPNRWISDTKKMEMIQNNFIENPSKEKEDELKFSKGNMVGAIGSRWKTLTFKISQQPTKVAYSVIGILSLLK